MMGMTGRAYCSATRTVTPRFAIPLAARTTSRWRSGERPRSGSARRSRRGRAAGAIPMARISLSPPESMPALRRRGSRRGGRGDEGAERPPPAPPAGGREHPHHHLSFAHLEREVVHGEGVLVEDEEVAHLEH